jgi:hypothetical protein
MTTHACNCQECHAIERDRIIALIERRICFDALADDDGRCSHHGGKCYDLRELINRLKKEATNGNV